MPEKGAQVPATRENRKSVGKKRQKVSISSFYFLTLNDDITKP